MRGEAVGVHRLGLRVRGQQQGGYLGATPPTHRHTQLHAAGGRERGTGRVAGVVVVGVDEGPGCGQYPPQDGRPRPRVGAAVCGAEGAAARPRG